MVRLFITIVVFLVGFLVLSQIVLPILLGRPLFWMFRGNSGSKLVEAEAEKRDAEHELLLAEIKAETETLRVRKHMIEMSMLDEAISALEESEQTQSKKEN